MMTAFVIFGQNAYLGDMTDDEIEFNAVDDSLPSSQELSDQEFMEEPASPVATSRPAAIISDEFYNAETFAQSLSSSICFSKTSCIALATTTEILCEDSSVQIISNRNLYQQLFQGYGGGRFGQKKFFPRMLYNNVGAIKANFCPPMVTDVSDFLLIRKSGSTITMIYSIRVDSKCTTSQAACSGIPKE
jgi:hypothetical protein